MSATPDITKLLREATPILISVVSVLFAQSIILSWAQKSTHENQRIEMDKKLAVIEARITNINEDIEKTEILISREDGNIRQLRSEVDRLKALQERH